MSFAVTCPHCHGSSQPGAFCEACGMALPKPVRTAPRVVESTKEFAATTAGRELQSDDLHKQAAKAATPLRWLGILLLIGGGLVFAGGAGSPRQGPEQAAMTVVGGAIALLGVIFIGLSIWARHQPLPAAIVGLLLYITLMALGAINDPASLASGWLIKILIISALIRSINAGLQHRRVLAGASGDPAEAEPVFG
jgi:hypothetical protein